MRRLHIITLLIFITIVLSIVHVVVSNMLSTTGIELDTIQADMAKYKKENILLREEVLEHGSLYHIASAAAEMGFVNAKSHVYVDTPLPLAKR